MLFLRIAALCAALISAGSVQAQNQDEPLLKQWSVDVVASHLAKFKVYPAASKARGEEGRVWVDFIIDRYGRLVDSRIYKYSCFEDLNNAAIEMIRRAAPYPPFPLETKQNRMTLRVPISYYFNVKNAPPLSVDVNSRSECYTS